MHVHRFHTEIHSGEGGRYLRGKSLWGGEGLYTLVCLLPVMEVTNYMNVNSATFDEISRAYLSAIYMYM